jgi:hypothetical protein
MPASEEKSIWDKLISKFMQATEYLIFEHSDVTQDFLFQDFVEEDLTPIIVSSNDFHYQRIQMGRFQNTTGINRLVNYLVKKTEDCLRHFQLSFILDVETLEFDQIKCDEFTRSQLPTTKEVVITNDVEQVKPNFKSQKIIKWIKSMINFHRPVKTQNSSVAEFSIQNILNYFSKKCSKPIDAGNDP